MTFCLRESNNITTTQYEQFIERYYGRHKVGPVKSNSDLRQTSNFARYQRCDVMGGRGVQVNDTILEKNSLETPPKSGNEITQMSNTKL